MTQPTEQEVIKLLKENPTASYFVCRPFPQPNQADIIVPIAAIHLDRRDSRGRQYAPHAVPVNPSWDIELTHLLLKFLSPPPPTVID